MDGVTADPVHRAILRHGWTGVLVEPLADMMQKLKATYSGCKGLGFEMAAITESPGDHRMYRVSPDAIDDGRAPDWAGGISSLYLDRNALSGQRVTEEDAARIRPFIVEETVAGIVFDDLVAKHGIDRMDVLQIDTEGADLMILRQVDLSKFRPKVIHLEFYNLPPTDKSACVELLKSHGYRVYIGADGVDLLSLRG